jgi:hypothetical protein
VIQSDAPRLLWAAFTGRNIDLLAMAVDLSVPPLALLMLLVSAIWFLSFLLFIFSKALIPIGIATIAAALLVVSILLSWSFYGRSIISLGGLALAALYALRKIPMYAKFLVSRQINWVRSKRDEE